MQLSPVLLLLLLLFDQANMPIVVPTRLSVSLIVCVVCFIIKLNFIPMHLMALNYQTPSDTAEHSMTGGGT